MKTIGIVGGIGPESTVDYYRLLLARAAMLAGTESPQVVINSVDYWAMRRLLDARDDAGLADMLVREIDRLQAAGAGVGVIAANTPHIVFDAVRARTALLLVSIVEARANELVRGQFLGSSRAGLVAVMERLRARDVDAVILGGTELPLILRDVPFAVPLLDTTRIHVDAAIHAALR